MTTPQLHYMVKCTNTGEAYGIPTEIGYYTKLASAFEVLMNVGCCNCILLPAPSDSFVD